MRTKIRGLYVSPKYVLHSDREELSSERSDRGPSFDLGAQEVAGILEAKYGSHQPSKRIPVCCHDENRGTCFVVVPNELGPAFPSPLIVTFSSSVSSQVMDFGRVGSTP